MNQFLELLRVKGVKLRVKSLLPNPYPVREIKRESILYFVARTIFLQLKLSGYDQKAQI